MLRQARGIFFVPQMADKAASKNHRLRRSAPGYFSQHLHLFHAVGNALRNPVFSAVAKIALGARTVRIHSGAVSKAATLVGPIIPCFEA